MVVTEMLEPSDETICGNAIPTLQPQPPYSEDTYVTAAAAVGGNLSDTPLSNEIDQGIRTLFSLLKRGQRKEHTSKTTRKGKREPKQNIDNHIGSRR